MNAAHFHLVVNHFPIILPIAGIMVMVIGLLAKSVPVKRVAHLLFIMGALGSIAAMTSGENAEEIVEGLSGVSETFIERHEEAAERFAVLTYILGGLSLAGLWASFKWKALTRPASLIVLLFALVVVWFGKETGTTGGEIRHPEIRADFNAPSSETRSRGEGQSERDHDD